MKHNILYLLLIPLVFSCKKKDDEFKSKITNHLKENNIKGSILYYSETQFTDADTLNKKRYSKDFYEIGPDGNLIERRHFGEGEKRPVIVEKINIDETIKESDKKLIEIHTNYNFNNILFSCYKIESYFEDNTLIKNTYVYDGDLMEISKSNFDKYGNLIELRKYDANNKLISREKYKYDKDNNRIEELIYDIPRDEKAPSIKVVFKHDKFGNITNQNHYSLKNNHKVEDPKYVWKYEYDSRGNWTRRFDFSGGHIEPYAREERTYVYRKTATNSSL